MGLLIKWDNQEKLSLVLDVSVHGQVMLCTQPITKYSWSLRILGHGFFVQKSFLCDSYPCEWMYCCWTWEESSNYQALMYPINQIKMTHRWWWWVSRHNQYILTSMNGCVAVESLVESIDQRALMYPYYQQQGIFPLRTISYKELKSLWSMSWIMSYIRWDKLFWKESIKVSLIIQHKHELEWCG